MKRSLSTLESNLQAIVWPQSMSSPSVMAQDSGSPPLPGGPIGRPFIMVLAGPDIQAMIDWYASGFGLVAGTPQEVADALNAAHGGQIAP